MQRAVGVIITHSVVANFDVGEFARQTGERCGVSGYRRANLLDTTMCTWPFLSPYFLPTILAASTGKSGVAFGMPVVGADAIGLYNTFEWALASALVIAVTTGCGRTREVDADT